MQACGREKAEQRLEPEPIQPWGAWEGAATMVQVPPRSVATGRPRERQAISSQIAMSSGFTVRNGAGHPEGEPGWPVLGRG